MGKITRFDIIYENTSGTFYAGQQVAGRVVLDITEATKIRCIKVRYLGHARVAFTDVAKSSRTHADKQEYFDAHDVIFGAPSDKDKERKSSNGGASGSGDPVTLEAGSHEFPFAFRLPSDLPSSYEAKHGWVRYMVRATLHRPWKFDSKAIRMFSVVAMLDLSQEPLAFTPGIGRTEQHFSMFDRLLSCMNGGLSVQLKIARSAYVPGEAILLNGEVLNNSSARVKAVEAYVQQLVHCTAKSGKRTFVQPEKIAQVSHGPLTRGDALVWREEPMSLPPLPPSRLGDACKLISIQYFLKLIVYLENAREVQMTLPLVIGTIPLHQQRLPWLPDQAPARPPPPQINRQPSAPPIEEYFGPPPTYEECAFMEQASGDLDETSQQVRPGPSAPPGGSDGEQESFGDQTYRPRYPIYPTLGPSRKQ